jgi:hypothetical protein
MNLNLFIAFMVIACISITCHLVCIGVFLRFGSQTAITTQVICMLHLSSLIQNVAGLPNVYLGNLDFCRFMGAINYVGGLGIVCCLILLSLAFYNFLNESKSILVALKRGRFVVCIFPLIAFLPFTTGSYSEYAGTWCTLNDQKFLSDVWAFCIFYIWALLALLLSTVIFCFVIIKNYAYGINIRGKLFATLGAYILCSWIYIIPRLVTRFVLFFGSINSDSDQFLSQISSYLCGIAFTCISYHSRDFFRKYERSMSSTNSEFNLSMGTWQSALNSLHDSIHSEKDRPSGHNESQSHTTDLSSSKGSKAAEDFDIETIYRRSSEAETH